MATVVASASAMEVDEVPTVTAEAQPDAEDDSSSIPEDEYEIEAILSHEVGRFKPNEIAYLVSWKGYGKEHNSWVREGDAENAPDMIKSYWDTANKDGVARKANGKGWTGAKSKKRAMKKESPDGASTSTAGTSVARGKRTGRTVAQEEQIRQRRIQTASQASYTRAGVEITDVSGIGEEDEVTEKQLKRLKPEEQVQVKRRMDTRRYASMPDWEQVVKYVETVEKDAEKGLIAFVIFENGQRYAYEAAVVNHRCPQKVIAFYESRLRFKAEAANLPPLTKASSLAQQQTARSDESETVVAHEEKLIEEEQPPPPPPVVEQSSMEEDVPADNGELAVERSEDTIPEETTLVGQSSDAIDSSSKTEGEPPSTQEG